MSRIRTLLLLSILALMSFSALAAEKLPVEAFAQLPNVSQVLLSPDGENVAFRVKVNTEEVVGTAIQVYNIASQQVTTLAFAKADAFVIKWIRWANDERLLVSARFPATRHGDPTTETRLQSINIKTREPREVLLVSFLRRQEYIPQFQDQIVDMLPSDADHILLAGEFERSYRSEIIKVNLKTGRTSRVLKGKDHITDWVTDRQHQVRIGVWLDETSYRILLRQPDGPGWDVLWEFEAFSEEAVWPMSFDKDPDYLYVRAYHEGRLAVFKVRLSDSKLEKELVFADPVYDAGGSLIYSKISGDVIGIRYSANGGFTFWDNDYQQLQAAIDAALPDTDNILYSLSNDEQHYVVLATSDTDPGTYYLGDREKNKLALLAPRYPALPVERMSEVQSVSYEARDGLAIEAFLTLPKDQGPMPYPVIIFPHGGPISFDDGGFDFWTQFFASRGYAVLRMNFRGSAEYGYDFMKSGLQAWGLEMQNDVEDGTRWLIQEGVADPERICVVGASYGGYAALMEAVRNPDLYKCAVSFAGVTDVAELVSSLRNYLNFDIAKEQIGSDYRSLRQRSPLYIVEDFEIPVLLAHGTKDRSVEVRHSQRMYRELKKSDKAVTYLELEDGDHHLSKEEHRVEFFRAMDKFLQAHM